MARRLAEGVYEDLVTIELAQALAVVRGSKAIDLAALGPADAHVVLSRFLRAEIERALDDLEGAREERLAQQVALTNDILKLLVARRLASDGQLVDEPAQHLRGIFPHASTTPGRPETPLAESTILTLGRNEPRIGSEFAREIESADRVDALVSFVTKGGVRQLRDAIDRLCRRYRPGGTPVLRLLTTTYTGATEASAVEELASLPGVQIKVSYDGRRTRLHAKAWLFHRATGLSTAYVGSANLSSPALTSGLEWMMKASAADLPRVIGKFAGAFDTLWEDPEFEAFDPANAEHARRLRGALSAAGSADTASVLTFFTLEPYPFQREILERVEAERALHGRHRNLIVAATGTGKTVIAAFDYARRAAAGLRPRLLFLAHSRKILTQARDTFRHVLREPSFGSLLTGQDEPASPEHLFATIQTVRSRELVEKLGGDYWDHVVIDECHHVPAASYQDVVPKLRPAVLVGLTATPERTDGRSLLGDFGGRVAAELRLWHALERQLLVPFEYYGIHDGIGEAEMQALRWTRQSGYELSDLDRLYTGNHRRAGLVMEQLARKVHAPREVHALGFCVSIAHAEFMARYFTSNGIPAIHLDGASSQAEREAAQRALEDRRVNVIFTCDLFNEGVDLPFVDTLLLLRPTQSATLFLQQLGRGLRLHRGKQSCLVLDFIGQHRAEFRFDAILSAWTGIPRARLTEAAANDFPYLPSGCTISLDQVARETILRSLRTSIEASWKRLIADVATVAGANHDLDLQTFLDESGRELDDLYRLNRGSWTKLRRDAGLWPPDASAPSEDELELCHRLGRLAHIDDRERLLRIAGWMAGEDPREPDALREALMLGYQIQHESRQLMAPEAVVPWLRSHALARDELRELTFVLEDRTAVSTSIRPVADCPLVLHHQYTRREILTAAGYWTPTRKVPHQQGVLRLEKQSSELLFVTLDKSDGRFSPSTRYRDYALSDRLFHWETQNTVADDSDTMKHYAGHRERGWSIHLFVQERKGTSFAYLGPVHYERHEGSRPVGIVWRLEYTMPAALARACETLASA
jgi:superfamily II DNA or RNA helicase/HKD family nuclease